MKHKFKLSINCDNAAFCDGAEPTQQSAAPELARILRDVADRIEQGELYYVHRNIKDINGNIVGTFVLSQCNN